MMHLAERRLARMAADIDWLRVRLPLVLAALETTAGDGYAGGSGERTSGSSHGSVVESAATDSSRARFDDLDARTAEAAGVVVELTEVVKRLPVSVDARLKHSAAAEALRARCTGGEGAWADPHCPNLAVRETKSDEIRGVTLDLCWTCISRRRRHFQQQDEAEADVRFG